MNNRHHLRSILHSIAGIARDARAEQPFDARKIGEALDDIENEIISARVSIERELRAEEHGMARFGGQHDEHGAPAGPGEQFATSLDAIAAQIMEMEPLDPRD
jgi:hypothetical protein